MRPDASVNLRRVPESSQWLQARRYHTGQEPTAPSRHPGTHVEVFGAQCPMQMAEADFCSSSLTISRFRVPDRSYSVARGRPRPN